MNIDGIDIENYIISKLSEFKNIINSKFILLLSDEWSYAINPSNRLEVSEADKQLGTFNLLDSDKQSIQISKLYSGNEHDRQIVHLSKYFKVEFDSYLKLSFNPMTIQFLRKNIKQVIPSETEIGMYMDCPFMERNLNSFRNFEYAYHQFIMDLVAQQVLAIKRILINGNVQQLYIDGKFSTNNIYMNLMSEAFFNTEVYAVSHNKSKNSSDKQESKMSFKKF